MSTENAAKFSFLKVFFFFLIKLFLATEKLSKVKQNESLKNFAFYFLMIF